LDALLALYVISRCSHTLKYGGLGLHHVDDVVSLPKSTKPDIITTHLHTLTGKRLAWKTKSNGPWRATEFTVNELRTISRHEIHLQHLTMRIGIQMATGQIIEVHRKSWDAP